MTAPSDLPSLISEGRRLIEEATKGPYYAAGGYLTRRNPESGSFIMSIFHIDETGQRAALMPFQAVPFARREDAAAFAFALNSLPQLLAVAEAASALSRQLDVVHGDPAYRGVWSLHFARGGEYTGPTYEFEKAALDAALRGEVKP